MPSPGQVENTNEPINGIPIRKNSANYIGIGAIIFVFMSILSFIASGALLWLHDKATAPSADILSALLYNYFPPLMMLGIGVLSAFIGVSLLHAAGEASATPPGPIINPEEWDALSDKIVEGNEDAITQYIRLRSLSGVAGYFTKLGLTGLPLATIGLTIFFSIMFLKHSEYLELAKLTLGAFIGSFVQKQVGERQGGGTVKLPSGETVSVKSAPPTPA